MHKHFMIEKTVFAKGDPALNNATVKKLWSSFCLGSSQLQLSEGQENTFVLGNIQPPVLEDGKEYALCVSETGAAVTGCDYGGLMRGLMVLLMKIECGKDTLSIRAVSEQSHYRIRNRMIHICVFPENDLYFIKKLVRLAGLCQYTHIVIEFWGMLQFDCLAELSWPHAFTKAQVRELLQEVRELGMEPIPMSNQLGHATASRLCNGKHVVLDQNPRLQHLFTPDGWAWNIESEDTFRLLKQIRTELYELFGAGEYIHIGCDEAYYYSHDERLHKKLPQYLHDLTAEVEKEGKKPMVWMDMLLEENAFPDCLAARAKKGESAMLQSALSANSVFVDWQYDIYQGPVGSLASLAGSGHPVIGAPWYDPRNYKAHIDTVIDRGLDGIMLTTWHTLKDYMPSLLGCAKECGAESFFWSASSGLHEQTAALLRRVSFEGNAYADCGWAKEQIEV